MSNDNDHEVKNFLKWKSHVTMASKDAYKNIELQLQNYSSTFLHKKTLPSATSIQSSSPTARNTTVSLEKLTCTNFVDFGNCQNRFG